MEIFAVHERLNVLAIADGHFAVAIFSSLSLQELQRVPEPGCRALSWHPRGPSLAVHLVRGSSAAIFIYTNVCAAEVNEGLQLRCAHQIQLDDLSLTVGMCLFSGHLILGGSALSVWSCTFTTAEWLPTAGAHFLHCAEEPELQRPLTSIGPALWVSRDSSERFLATWHEGREGELRIWFLAESGAGGASTRPRREKHMGHKVPCALPTGRQSPVDGVQNIVLQHWEPLAGMAWCGSTQGNYFAKVATISSSGAVTLWRECARCEVLTFLVEGLWHPDDLWLSTSPNVSLVSSSICWATVRRAAVSSLGSDVDEGLGCSVPGLPLRPSGHGSDEGLVVLASTAFSGGPVPSTTLVVLRGGQTRMLNFDDTCGNLQRPLDVRLISVSALRGCASSLLMHATTIPGELRGTVELLIATSRDVCRVHLASRDRSTVLAVTGGLAKPLGHPDSAPPDAPSKVVNETALVEEVVVNHVFGFAASLVTENQASVRGSVVLISELPHGRAVPLGALYDLREDAMRKLTIGSVRFEPGLRSVTWSPGRVAPPLLMGVSSSGELVSCVIDPVRGVGSGADWTAVVWSRDTGETSVCNVMQLGTACEEDDERAIVFLLRLNRENRVEFVLARLEVPTWARVPSLTPLLTHVMDATSVVCSLEWFGTCDGESAERGVVGQLAVWRGEDVGHIDVHLLLEVESVLSLDTEPLAAAVSGSAVQSLMVHGEWLIALTSCSQVLLWCLTAGVSGAELRHRFDVPTKPLTNRNPSTVATPFRPWSTQGAVSHTARQNGGLMWSTGLPNSTANQAAASKLSRGAVTLHRFASGGKAILVSGGSQENVMMPHVIVYTRHARDGDTWRMVNLHVAALPLIMPAISWMRDGSILYAGRDTSGSSTVVAVQLPHEVFGWLEYSAPCPAYHPEVLMHLIQCRPDLARKVLLGLLQALRNRLAIEPLLGIAYDAFHAGDVDWSFARAKAMPFSTDTAEATAADLFKDGSAIARLDRAEHDESPSPLVQASADPEGWWLSAADADELADLLQTSPLPMVSAGEQAFLMCLLQDKSIAPTETGLDECARMYLQAFKLHRLIQRRPLGGALGEPGAVPLQLSSEDLCWALHSSCQSTLVQMVVSSYGCDLGWAVLRSVGVGLWLTDRGAIKELIETLPRSIIKRQGRDIKPESVALWYALLGKRTLLSALYKQQKQEKVAEFLSHDLAVEPWSSKAKKNAFELVRQRRFDLGIAFFILAGEGRSAIDVCVRYLDDWPLAMLISRHLMSGGDTETRCAMQRALLQDLLPVARRARDPWLASLGAFQAGEYVIALRAVTPPYNVPLDEMDEGDAPSSLTPSQLFSGGLLRHSGVTPSLPRFLRTLREVIAKNRLLGGDGQLPDTGGVSPDGMMAIAAKAYLDRRQPLLAVPLPSHVVRLPFRIAVGIGRALVGLICNSGQPLLLDDGSTVFSKLSRVLCERLLLPSAVARGILSEVCSDVGREVVQDQVCSAFVDVVPFYSVAYVQQASEVREVLHNPESISKVLPPYLHAYVGDDARWHGTAHLSEEISFCHGLRSLTITHAARAFALDESKRCTACLAALVWRVLPHLRASLQDPQSRPLPLPTMHLASHLVCALCVSRSPSPVLSERLAILPFEMPGDLAHIVTALTLTLSMLLTLSALTPQSGLWTGDAKRELFRKPFPDSEGCADDAWDTLELLIEELPILSDAPEPSSETPSRWEPVMWQGLRVLLEHLDGSAHELRKLHRSGVLPSLIVSLFLQPSFSVDASVGGSGSDFSSEVLPLSARSIGSGARSPQPQSPKHPGTPSSPCDSDDEPVKLARTTPDDALRILLIVSSREPEVGSAIRVLLSCMLTELAVERLVSLLSSIRKKTPGGALHWITTWYDSLLTTLQGFLNDHVQKRVVGAALALAKAFEDLPLALCASERRLSALGEFAGGAPFLAVWNHLNGTRRLQILFSHHPALSYPGTSLLRRNAVLWKGSGAPIRFVCSDRVVPWQLVVHARGISFDMQAAHAARWFTAKGEEERSTVDTGLHRYDTQADSFAPKVLNPALSGPHADFDPATEMLLGGLKGRALAPRDELSVELTHFMSSLQKADGACRPGSDSARVAPLCAEAHPSRPMYAVATEDCLVHLWAFGEASPRCTLPRPPEASERRRFGTTPSARESVSSVSTAAVGGSEAAAMSTVSMAPGDVPEAVPTGREQRRCTLAWNEAGDRLISVGNHTGVTMWTIGEDRSTFQVCTVPTGAAMAKVNCGIFVSPATVIATAGRKTEIEMGVNPHGISAFGSLKTWPYTSAGLCVWDTLAPPQSSLVMHDGNTDMPPVVPSHYSCLTWAADRQQIICGTKTGELRIFDIRQRKVCQRLVAHEDSVMYSFVLGGTGRFATLSAKAELKVWSLSDFTCIETLSKLHRTSGVSSVIGKSQVLNCAAMISERHLVTGGCDGTLLLTRL